MCDITDALQKEHGGEWRRVALSPGDMAVFKCGDEYMLCKNRRMAALIESANSRLSAALMAHHIVWWGADRYEESDAAYLLKDFAKHLLDEAE